MRPSLTVLLCCCYWGVMAQLRPPELYVEGSVFYEEQLEPLSSYNAIAIGAEPLSYKFIALDLNYALYFGGNNDERERLNDNFETVFKSVLGRDFWAWNFGIGPRFILETEAIQFVLMPKYHFVQQNAKGEYIDSEDLAINQRQKAQSKHWSLAVGFEYLAENTHSKIGLYLHYTRFNAGATLNQLNFEDQGYTKSRYNTPAIGITLRLSTGFKKQL